MASARAGVSFRWFMPEPEPEEQAEE